MDIYTILRNLVKPIDGNKWVDKDYGQIDNYKVKPPVSFPCTLIKVALPQQVTLTRGTQLCSGTVTIRSAYDLAVIETSGAVPDEALNRSLSASAQANAVYIALQGYVGQGITVLDRISGPIDETRKDGLSVVKQVFNVEFLDTSAADA